VTGDGVAFSRGLLYLAALGFVVRSWWDHGVEARLVSIFAMVGVLTFATIILTGRSER
jgi:hypothetical protein